MAARALAEVPDIESGVGVDGAQPRSAEPSGFYVVERPSFRNGLLLLVIGIMLAASGAAGLINQIAWQRSLKIFLGGSESLCSTVVVLVFLAGLGIGSALASGIAQRCRSPWRLLAAAEATLAGANALIALLLQSDLQTNAYALQRFLAQCGIPVIGIYAFGAAAVLLVPCLIMGATMPLVAEAVQRTIPRANSRLLPGLMALNTLGSVGGSVLAGGMLIPQLGLWRTMLVAVGLNVAAAAAVLFLRTSSGAAEGTAEISGDSQRTAGRGRLFRWPSMYEQLAMWLGFCSLAFEMHLLRLFPLTQQPLPTTFSAVLTGFLIFWSAGAALSTLRPKISANRVLQIGAVGCVLTIVFSGIDSVTPVAGALSLLQFVLKKSHFFLPCLCFGWLFGRLTMRAAQSWGSDVGRLYAWNTVGSCCGIPAMTFIGYEMPFYLSILVIGLLLLGLQRFTTCWDGSPRQSGGGSGLLNETHVRLRQPLFTGPIMAWAGAVLLTLIGSVADLSRLLPGQALYCGRDGVIVVKPDGALVWDGLWHSQLSDGASHVGTHNWHLAVMPVLCHTKEPIRECCVIGLGTGITAATLAQLQEVERVDAYDISTVLRDVMEDYPEGTLHTATNPKIQILWQDARSGLALRDQEYDLIQTQPLYLKQAGSALLNSVEFFELVRARLRPGGVFCLYCNGTPEQAFVVRETARRVFPHCRTFFNGYLAVLSDQPVVLDEDVLRERLSGEDPFWAEVAASSTTGSAEAIMKLADHPELPGDARFVVTDDLPIVEYPHLLSERIRAARLPFTLPQPNSGYSE